MTNQTEQNNELSIEQEQEQELEDNIELYEIETVEGEVCLTPTDDLPWMIEGESRVSLYFDMFYNPADPEDAQREPDTRLCLQVKLGGDIQEDIAAVCLMLENASTMLNFYPYSEAFREGGALSMSLSYTIDPLDEL